MRIEAVRLSSPEAAYERAYETYWQDVFRFALAWTNDWASAQDLTLEAYMRLWKQRAGFDWDREALPWLILATRRLATDRFRALRRRFTSAPPPASPSEDVRARWLDVQAAMGRLSPLERASIVMTTIEGRPTGEAGIALGVSPGAVRAAVSRAARPPGGPPQPVRTPAFGSAPILVVATIVALLAIVGPRLGPGSTVAPDATFGPDAGRADWWVDPADLPLSADTTEIHGLVQERACASGTSPEGRLYGPRIEYGANEVTVTFAVREIGGRCPSNPVYPVTIKLSEPLGNRTLIDGGAEPPRNAVINPTVVLEPTFGPAAGQADWWVEPASPPLSAILRTTY